MIYLPYLLAVWAILHVALIPMTGATSFSWIARGFLALECAQWATVRVLPHWWKQWKVRYLVLWREQQPQRVPLPANVERIRRPRKKREERKEATG